jgi:hypothetical protein
MNEPTGNEVVVAGRYLGTVFGAAQIELSEWLGDFVRTRRLRSMAKTLRKTEQILTDAGIEARSVPLKTLSAILEGAAQEDDGDDDMIARWANLLARAATERGSVPPSFAEVLSQLTPQQVEILDYAYRNSRISRHKQTRYSGAADWKRGMGGDDRALAVVDLMRLGLVSDVNASGGYEQAVQLRPFGAALVELCTVPPGAGEPPE